MTRERQIVEAAKAKEKETGFGELVKSHVSREVNSAYGIGFLEGAEWADEHPNNPYKDVIAHINSNAYKVWKQNLWYDAQGDVLPEIDREVIVIDIRGKISYGHRPDPKGFYCKNIDTGEIEHLEPKTYDKGGWNFPDVRWWLDVSIPNLEEQQ